jgi:Zn finger protein HypA/HybF involved in hydrogenase expression
MLPKKRLTYLTATLALLVMVTAWVVVRDYVFAPVGPPRSLVCPECGFVQPFVQPRLGKPCPKCGAGKLAGTDMAVDERTGHPISPHRNLVADGLILVTALLAGAYAYFLLRSPGGPRPRKKTTYLHCRCHQCHGQVRYEARAEAHTVLCPTCRYEVTVPAAKVSKLD